MKQYRHIIGIIILPTILWAIYLQGPETVDLCNPQTHNIQSVPENSVAGHLNAGWTYPPCVVEVPVVEPTRELPNPTRRPPDVPANPDVQPPGLTQRPPDLPEPTHRPPDVPPANPIPTPPPILVTPSSLPTFPPTRRPPTPTVFQTVTTAPTWTSTPTLIPTTTPIPQVQVYIPTPTILSLTETMLLQGTATPPRLPTPIPAIPSQTASPDQDVLRLIINFIERNPGLLAVVIAIFALVPIIVNAEVNRRMEIEKDRLADNQLQRDTIVQQRQALERVDESRFQERKETRTDFLTTLTSQSDKFSAHIEKLTASQASTTAALEKSNAISTELIEQLKIMRADAARRDELHRAVQKSVADQAESMRAGFKEISDSIKELVTILEKLEHK